MVRQGDLLHADANGVSEIPVELAAEVADVAGEFVAAEEIVLDYVKAPGEKSIVQYDALRGEFMEAVSQLQARVKRS